MKLLRVLICFTLFILLSLVVNAEENKIKLRGISKIQEFEKNSVKFIIRY